MNMMSSSELAALFSSLATQNVANIVPNQILFDITPRFGSLSL